MDNNRQNKLTISTNKDVQEIEEVYLLSFTVS